MKNSVKILFSVLLAFALHTTVFAQPEFDDDVEDTPVDGGISLLIGAGIAYGVKKAYQLKKENKQND